MVLHYQSTGELVKNEDPKPSPRHSDLISLDWDSGIFIFNKHLILMQFDNVLWEHLSKSQGRFLKIIYNSQYGTWAWFWKQPAFPLHLCLWKTGTVFCNCASYSEVSYINRLYNYTQEHHGLLMCFCEVVFNFNYLFSTGSHYSFQDVFFSFLIDIDQNPLPLNIHSFVRFLLNCKWYMSSSRLETKSDGADGEFSTFIGLLQW